MSLQPEKPNFVGGPDSSAIGVPKAQEAAPNPLAAGAARIDKLSGPPADSAGERRNSSPPFNALDARWHV